MQLDSNECSFMTYFDSENEALFFISALKTEGFNNVQLSYVSEFPQHNISGGNQTLSSKILGSGNYDQQYGPLLAADPSVSGMSSYAGRDLISPSYLVTVVANNVDTDKVRQILNRK